MSYLQLEGLAKSFGDFTALQDINLSVEKGEFLSLLGPSGCGKTTTLQMVAGFVEPTRGRITLGGRDITQVRPEKRGLGIVFQSYALFPHMTVEDNIGFGLEMRNVPAAERKQRIREALGMVRLEGREKRYPRELSGGQRQRVALARALAINPDVLLLDEPMSNLDAKLREEMHIELRALQKKLGITTILVTHDQVEAMTMSDRVAVMHSGRIVQLAAPFDAYEFPQTAFASSFLGKTNTLDGNVAVANSSISEVKIKERTFRVSCEHILSEGPVKVFLRPERISVTAPGRGNIDGKVHTRLFLGSHWMLEVDTAVGRLLVTMPNQGAAPPGEGENVGLCWTDGAMRALQGNEGSNND